MGEHDVERHAIDAKILQPRAYRDARPVEATVRKQPVGHRAAKAGIQQEQNGKDGQGPTDGPSRGFECNQQGQRAKQNVDPGF